MSLAFQSYNDNSGAGWGDGSSSTVTGVAIGTAAASRVVVAWILPTNGTLTALTIGGVSATVDSTGNFWKAAAPTGTTATIVGTGDTIEVGATLTVTGDAAASWGTGSSVPVGNTTSVSVAAGGIVIALGQDSTFTTTCNFTAGVTGDGHPLSNSLAFGHGSFASAQSVTVTINITAANGLLEVSPLNPSGGGGGVTGSLAATDTPDTASVSAAVKVTGSLSPTEAIDTASISAKVKVASSLAASEGADTAAIAAGIKITGSFAVSESPDAVAITATVSNTVNASLAATEGQDTAAISGAVTVTGSLAAIESADVAAVSAAVSVAASLAANEAADTASITASAVATASFALTENPDTASQSAQVIVTGSLVATDAQDIASFNAGSGTNAVLVATDAQDAASFAATVAQPVLQVVTAGGGGYEHRKRKERDALRHTIERVFRELDSVAEVVDPEVARSARETVETVSKLPEPSKANEYGAALGRMSKSLAAIQQAANDIERMQHAAAVQRQAIALAREIETQRLQDEQDEEEVIALLMAS